MNKSRIIITMLSLLILLLFTLLPVSMYSVEQASSEVATENSSLLKTDPLNELSSSEETTETTEIPEVAETTETAQIQESPEESAEEQQKETTTSSTEESESVEKKQARANVASDITITDWQLLKNGVPLSETVHAVTGETYELKFRWRSFTRRCRQAIM